MASVSNTTLLNFIGGELSPQMAARSDNELYPKSLSWCQNFIVLPQGPVSYRPGTLLIGLTKLNLAATIIPFQFDANDAIVIVATPNVFRFYRNNAVILNAAPITAITQANPAVVTAANNFVNGDQVTISGVEGMTQLNGNTYTISGVSGTGFTLTGVNSTGFGAYTGVGEAAIANNITGITQASPAVVTAASHGFSNGQEVFISGVQGMLQVNGRSFIVAGVTTNTFQLEDQFGAVVNSTAYSPYTSGGTANTVYELATPYVAADLPNLRYTQTGDVMYITNSNYAPYKLTRANFTSWTLAAVAFTNDPFSAGNYPAVCAFTSDGRLDYANTPNNPEGLWGSEVPSGTTTNYDNFTTGSGLATNAYAFDFAPVEGVVDSIFAIKQFGSMLALLGASSIRQVYGATQQVPPTPTEINSWPTIQGCANAQPLVVNWDLIFIDVNQKKIRGLQYNLAFNDYQAIDYNITSQHFGQESQFVKLAWAKGTPDIIWVLRENGTLLCFTFNNIENVQAFSRHIFGNGAKVLDIGTIVNGNQDAQLWMVVQRTINGQTFTSVEVLDQWPVFQPPRSFYTGNQDSDLANWADIAWETQKNNSFLDCALVYDGRARGLAANATLTLSATSGVFTITSNEAVFQPTDVGSQLWKTYQQSGTSVSGGGQCLITGYTSPTSITASSTAPFDNTSAIAPGLWEFAVNKINNLYLYNNQTVNVQADGGNHPAQTVTSGSISLQWFAARVMVGFSYLGLMASQNLDFGSKVGPANSKPRNVKRIRVRFESTVGAQVGTSEYYLKDVVMRTANQIMNRVAPPQTAMFDLPQAGTWDNNIKQVVIAQSAPSPCNVTGIDVEMHVNESP